MNAPLAGIRIVEVGHMLAGPYCGLMLADLGAEVIKIEAPEGDIARSVSPHFVGPHNAYFASLNRNKKSVVLDLASEEGREALGRIVETAHALVTNLRPSAIRKLGLTYDYVIQAMTGVMALTGDPAAPPTKAGYSAVDNSAGLVAAVGLLAKIVHGQGGQVDVAMYDVMLSQLNYLAGAALNAGQTMERLADSSHPYVVPAQIFATADGWLTLFITHDKFWKIFCDEIARPEWIADPRFATMAARRTHRAQVISAVAEVLRQASAAEWVRRLAPLGVVAAEVGTLNAALRSDIAAARALVVTLGDGSLPLQAVACPIRFQGYAPTYGLPPLLDEHGDAVLGRVAT